jgi:hypothetical protein
MGMGRAILSQPCEAPATLEAARSLAHRYGEASAPFWARRANEAKDFAERGLALATLVALSDRPAGETTLAGRLFDTPSIMEQHVAFGLICDLHGAAARPLLEHLVTEACRRLRAKPNDAVRLRTATVTVCAGELLGAVGNEATRHSLSDLLAQGGNGGNDPSAHYLRRALDGLDARLAQPVSARAAWSRDAVEFAKATWLYQDDISAENGAYRAAGRLADRGVRPGIRFLKFQLSGRSSASDLAIAVAGNQRETELIPDLVGAAQRTGGGYKSSMAMAALGQIGTREALDALLTLVRPNLELRIAAPLSVLAQRGDATTLRALVRLANNPSFKVADQADIAAARDYLAARLAGKIPQPMMGNPGPQFPPR